MTLSSCQTAGKERKAKHDPVGGVGPGLRFFSLANSKPEVTFVGAPPRTKPKWEVELLRLGRFNYGGWIVPYFDEQFGAIMHDQMARTRALLLGKKTYEIFASYWPTHESDWPGINSATKYVVSDKPTESLWDNTVFIEDDVVGGIRRVKQQDGPDLQVYGSSQLLQTLFKHDLADELWLKIFPITLGTGKRLFGEGTMPAHSSSRTQSPHQVESLSPVTSVPGR